MIKRPTRNRVSILAGLLLLGSAASAVAQVELNWFTIDGGGEMFTTGGDIELSGTMGQPDASVSVMTGGDIELIGGFWNNCVVPCFGDLDYDCDRDLADLAQLLSRYGTTSGATYEDGDMDGDGDVDLADLAALLSVYGDPCP
jgi:hypothetical protein